MQGKLAKKECLKQAKMRKAKERLHIANCIRLSFGSFLWRNWLFLPKHKLELMFSSNKPRACSRSVNVLCFLKVHCSYCNSQLDRLSAHAVFHWPISSKCSLTVFVPIVHCSWLISHSDHSIVQVNCFSLPPATLLLHGYFFPSLLQFLNAVPIIYLQFVM